MYATKRLLEGGAIVRVEQGACQLDHSVGAHAEEIPIERAMMKLAEREPVGHLDARARISVGQDVRRIQEIDARNAADGAAGRVGPHDVVPELGLVQSTVRLDGRVPALPFPRQHLAPGGPCPFLGREAWVSAEGRFDPCCAPDAERRTMGELGNLHDATLMQIWNGTAYRQLGRTYRTRSLCLGCNMRRPVSS